MMSGRHRAILAEAAAVAGPLIVLSAARLMLGSAPVSVSAGPSSALPIPVPPTPAKARTPEQQRASDWLKGLAGAGTINSPMDHPVAPPKVEKTPDPAPVPVQVEPTSPLAGLSLSGLLGNNTGGLAAINGKIYKVGDRVHGLVLTTIDIKNDAVEFTTADGAVLRLVRPRP